MSSLSTGQGLLVLAVALLVSGRLPQTMSDLARCVRTFRRSMRDKALPIACELPKGGPPAREKAA